MHEDIVAAMSKLHSFELVSLNQILSIISSAVRKSLIISKNQLPLVSKAKAVMYLLVIFTAKIAAVCVIIQGLWMNSISFFLSTETFYHKREKGAFK